MAKKEILNNDAVTVRVEETVADVLSDAADVMEQTIDLLENQVERVVTVTKNNPFVIAAALVVGVALGGVAAYKYASRKEMLRYEALMEEETEQIREFYQRTVKAGDFETPESAVAALVPEEVVSAVRDYSGGPKTPYNRPEDIVVTPPADDPRPPIRNVFADAADLSEWDAEAELSHRIENSGAPYVINFQEWEDNPDSHEQLTLTYYEGDQVLADAADSIVDNPNYIVGDDNLVRFGHGSNDSNVVYIRNERITADYEVLRSTGSYQVEVLGMTAGELKHSATVRHPNRIRNSATPRRFREHDDE